jgi:hypothetical protein
MSEIRILDLIARRSYKVATFGIPTSIGIGSRVPWRLYEIDIN